MYRACCVVAALLTFAALSFAQDPGSSEQQTIRQLAEQVKELQEKVKALEARQSAPPTEGAPSPAQLEAVEEAPDTSLAQAGHLHELHGIQWRGFGEVSYKVLDQRKPELGAFGFNPGSAGNFYTGDFDLFLTSRLTDKASVLAEMVFGEGYAQTFNIEMERLLFKYDYNDHLKMSFGRYRTGIGYYNVAYHSGKWLQTAADRPLIMEFADNGGLLPTQAVGISVTGLIPSGKLGLNYLVEYGSGDTVRPDINGLGTVDDENNGDRINLGFFVRPDAIPGLQVGGSFYHDKITAVELGPSVRMGQTIVNGHVIYLAHGVEFLNEGFLIRHAFEHSSGVLNMPAFYTQFSKRIGHFRPYFRYQYINANPDSIFRDVGLRHGPSLGVRYDVNDDVALKTQLDHTVRSGEPDLNGLQMQLAFTF